MKLSFLTACLPNVSLEALTEFASTTGFDALELAAWPVDSSHEYQAQQIDAATFTEDDAKRIEELFDRYDLEIASLAYYDNNLDPDPKKRESVLTHLKRVIDTAALLKVKLVGTFVGGRPDKLPAEIIKEAGTVLRPIVKYAADKGVNIMIENCPMENWQRFGLPGNFAYSPELWDALFTEIPEENFGLNFDPSHLYWLGIDYLRAAREYSSKIFFAHAKDTEFVPEGRYRFGPFGKQIDPTPWKSGWWRYRMPGLGDIEWNKFISTLQENGYDYVLSIEHEDPIWEGSEDKVLKGLQLGYNHLSQFVL
jgi:sugar phosphate isomerase/epimerase